MGKVIDSPPVWTVLVVALAWAQVAVTGPVLRGLGLGALGWLLVAAGLALTIAAAREFRAAQTTILPHGAPTQMITSGVFARSRNPIYLADTIVIAGFGLIFGAWIVVVLIPVFVRVITRRFIEVEEGKLSARFRDEFDVYAREVPRWADRRSLLVGKGRSGQY